jgi:NTP pyrophosphatase (non-canonical NTP hydrolase)
MEQTRQLKLWGEQNHSDLMWLPILGEEVGEVSKAINDVVHGDPLCHPNLINLKEELIHTAAVAMSWLEAIERRELNG